jgi:hypothetical protein
VRRLARSSLAYGAAILAGAIALVSALEAWDRLQNSDTANGPLPLAGEALVGLVLPLIAVAGLVALNWLVRRVRGDTAPPLGSKSPE